MFVPEKKDQRHAISMFLATAGAAGPLLGSDEREVIYLVFGVFDLQSKEVSDQRKLVRAARSIREIPEKHVFFG